MNTMEVLTLLLVIFVCSPNPLIMIINILYKTTKAPSPLSLAGTELPLWCFINLPPITELQ